MTTRAEGGLWSPGVLTVALTGPFEKRTALIGFRGTYFDSRVALVLVVPVGVADEETFVKFAERGLRGMAG